MRSDGDVLPRAIAVSVATFDCGDDERDCATPKLGPGRYPGFLEKLTSGRRFGQDRYRFVTADEALVVPLASPTGGVLHLKRTACALVRPHVAHSTGWCPSGPTACPGDVGPDIPFGRYYDAGDAVLVVEPQSLP